MEVYTVEDPYEKYRYWPYTFRGQYFGTGEGLATYVMFIYAKNEQEVYLRAVECFGWLYAQCGEIEQGLNIDCSEAQFLLSPKLLEGVKEGKFGKSTIHAFQHFNLS